MSLRDAIAEALHDEDCNQSLNWLTCFCDSANAYRSNADAALKVVAEHFFPVGGKFRFTDPADRPHGQRELGWVIMNGWDVESDVPIYRPSPALVEALTKEANDG